MMDKNLNWLRKRKREKSADIFKFVSLANYDAEGGKVFIRVSTNLTMVYTVY